MTVNEIVDRLFKFYNGSSINANLIRSFLRDNNTTVNEMAVNKILDTYNRQLIEGRGNPKSDPENEFNKAYIKARKELDSYIGFISKKLSTEEIIELKQKINDLVEKTILWSRK